MYISSLEMYISSLKIYKSNLKIHFSSSIGQFSGRVRKFFPEDGPTFVSTRPDGDAHREGIYVK